VLSQKLALPPLALLVQKPRHEGQQQHRSRDHPDEEIRADRRGGPHDIPQVGPLLCTPSALSALLHQPDHRAFHRGHLTTQAALFPAVSGQKGAEPFWGSLHAALECLSRFWIEWGGGLPAFRAMRRGHLSHHCRCGWSSNKWTLN
jgi:hypothetical protein